MPPGSGQPTPVVDPVEDVNKPVVVKPGEQQPQGDAPGGQAQPEAHDRFRDEQYRGPNPSIGILDRPASMVKPVVLQDNQGNNVELKTYNKNGQVTGLAPDGAEYRRVERNGTVHWQPMSAEANRRPLTEVSSTRTTTQPAGDQTVSGNPRRIPTTDATDADGRKLNPQRELGQILAPADMNNLRKQFGDLPREQRDAAWNQAYTAAKQRLDSGVAPRTEGLIDRTTLPGKPATVAGVERPAVLPAVEGKPVKDGAAVAQPLQRPETVPVDQTKAAAQRYAELVQQGNERAARDYLQGVKKDLGPDAARDVFRESQRIREAQVANPTDGRTRPELTVPVKENVPIPGNQAGRDPIKAGIQMEGERPQRQAIEAQIAALKAQQQQLDGNDRGQRRDIQAEIAALKAQVHQQPGERGEFRDGRGGPLDAKQLQEIAQRQQRDLPLTPAMEAKIKTSPNPDALAIFNQSWKEGKDRDGRGGDLGLRGRLDAGDQMARALDASKGGPNQKGIPGFDINDKATREFLNDAMKRLDLTKGQRVEDIFKGLDPTKADRLTKFLTEGSLDGKFNPARVKDFIGMSDQLRNPTDRLYDFLKSNKDLINNQQMSAKDTQRMLGDLTKILGDVNKQLGLDGGRNALNLQDVLGRKLDPTRPGERLAAMEQNGINRQMTERPDALAMTARMTAAQEIALRQMLDLRNGRDAFSHQGAARLAPNLHVFMAGNLFERLADGVEIPMRRRII